MAQGEVGSAYVSIYPNMKWFTKQLKSDLQTQMANISVEIPINPDAKQFAKDVNKEVAGKTKTAANDAGKNVSKGVGDGMRSNIGMVSAAAAALGAVIATQVGGALLNLGKASVMSASDLNESINAVRVTFGDTADEILSLSDAAVETTGLSKSAFNQLSVQVSSFAKSIAGPGGDVAGVVDDLTRRVADFASVMNLDVNEAAALFASTLAGESEPIRRYGKDISAAAVEQFAYANGIAETGKELTETQKVQARYGLLMQETQSTQNDFINTGDQFANAQRKLRAEWENQKALLGESMLPLLGQLSVKLREIMPELTQMLIPAFQSFAEKAVAGLQWVIDNWDKIKLAVNSAKLALQQVTEFVANNWQHFLTAAAAVTALRTAFLLLNLAMMANPVGIVIALVLGLIGLLAWAFKDLWDSNEEFRESVKGLWQDIKRVWNDTEPFRAEMVAAWEDIKQSLADAFDWFMADVWPEIKEALPEMFRLTGEYVKGMALWLERALWALEKIWPIVEKIVGAIAWITDKQGGWAKYSWTMGLPPGLRELAQFTMHDGGMVGGSGDVPITAQSGEFVLSRQMVAQMGAGQLEAWRQGGPSPGGVNVQSLVINNPSPERASESLPRAIRNLTYAAGAL